MWEIESIKLHLLELLMLMKQGNHVLFDNVGIGQVEVMLPFGISAHFTEPVYNKKGINVNMWKSPMTEKHADEMDMFAQNLIDVRTELKNNAEKIKKTAEKKKRKLQMKASQRSSKASSYLSVAYLHNKAKFFLTGTDTMMADSMTGLYDPGLRTYRRSTLGL